MIDFTKTQVTQTFMNVVIWQKIISNVYILYSMLYHSLKVTIHLIAIWKWCQHDFMKTMKPHRFWVNLSALKANWIGFSYLSTSILCTTNILPSSLHLSPITKATRPNVTWTNKSSLWNWLSMVHRESLPKIFHKANPSFSNKSN